MSDAVQPLGFAMKPLLALDDSRGVEGNPTDLSRFREGDEIGQVVFRMIEGAGGLRAWVFDKVVVMPPGEMRYNQETGHWQQIRGGKIVADWIAPNFIVPVRASRRKKRLSKEQAEKIGGASVEAAREVQELELLYMHSSGE